MIIRGERIAVEIIKTGRQGGEGRQDDRKANKQDYRREKEDSTTKRKQGKQYNREYRKGRHERKAHRVEERQDDRKEKDRTIKAKRKTGQQRSVRTQDDKKEE